MSLICGKSKVVFPRRISITIGPSITTSILIRVEKSQTHVPWIEIDTIEGDLAMVDSVIIVIQDVSLMVLIVLLGLLLEVDHMILLLVLVLLLVIVLTLVIVMIVLTLVIRMIAVILLLLLLDVPYEMIVNVMFVLMIVVLILVVEVVVAVAQMSSSFSMDGNIHESKETCLK